MELRVKNDLSLFELILTFGNGFRDLLLHLFVVAISFKGYIICKGLQFRFENWSEGVGLYSAKDKSSIIQIGHIQNLLGAYLQ